MALPYFLFGDQRDTPLAIELSIPELATTDQSNKHAALTPDDMRDLVQAGNKELLGNIKHERRLWRWGVSVFLLGQVTVFLTELCRILLDGSN